MQKRERENRIGERNVRNEILNNARDTWDEGDERKVERFFAVCRVPLRNGMLDAKKHCRENVDKVQPDQERHQPLELECCCMAVICKTINADANADENTDDAWCRKERK